MTQTFRGLSTSTCFWKMARGRKMRNYFKNVGGPPQVSLWRIPYNVKTHCLTLHFASLTFCMLGPFTAITGRIVSKRRCKYFKVYLYTRIW